MKDTSIDIIHLEDHYVVAGHKGKEPQDKQAKKSIIQVAIVQGSMIVVVLWLEFCKEITQKSIKNEVDRKPPYVIEF